MLEELLTMKLLTQNDQPLNEHLLCKRGMAQPKLMIVKYENGRPAGHGEYLHLLL